MQHQLGQRRLELGEIVQCITESLELFTRAEHIGRWRLLVVERDLEPGAI
jgi:hypothetical protein